MTTKVLRTFRVNVNGTDLLQIVESHKPGRVTILLPLKENEVSLPEEAWRELTGLGYQVTFTQEKEPEPASEPEPAQEELPNCRTIPEGCSLKKGGPL